MICFSPVLLIAQQNREELILPSKVQSKISKAISKELSDTNNFMYADLKEKADFIELSIYAFPEIDQFGVIYKVINSASTYFLFNNRIILIKPKPANGQVNFVYITTPLLRIRYITKLNKIKIKYFFKSNHRNPSNKKR